jgi:hypothetical protein
MAPPAQENLPSTMMAIWYVAPWLGTQQRGEALTLLLWVHAFRHVALEIFSAVQGSGKCKTLQQTVTFKASPQEVYDMLMDSKKHQSLSGVSAKISNKVGGKFTAWGSHLSGI